MKNFIKKIIATTGYSLNKIKEYNIQFENQITKDNFFDLYFSRINPADFFFVQIGANDGITHDPIYPYITKYKLSGIVVEPQPEVFELLRETYKDFPNVECINIAISDTTGERLFYMAKESTMNEKNYSMMTGIATLDKDVLRHTIKNKIPRGVNVDDFIQEKLIKTVSFKDLLRERGITKIDFIQLDCEGYDYEIIKMIDFDCFSPSIINFESNHISDADREECQKMFESKGYKWFRHNIDTCAYKA